MHLWKIWKSVKQQQYMVMLRAPFHFPESWLIKQRRTFLMGFTLHQTSSHVPLSCPQRKLKGFKIAGMRQHSQDSSVPYRMVSVQILAESFGWVYCYRKCHSTVQCQNSHVCKILYFMRRYKQIVKIFFGGKKLICNNAIAAFSSSSSFFFFFPTKIQEKWIKR